MQYILRFYFLQNCSDIHKSSLFCIRCFASVFKTFCDKGVFLSGTVPGGGGGGGACPVLSIKFLFPLLPLTSPKDDNALQIVILVFVRTSYCNKDKVCM